MSASALKPARRWPRYLAGGIALLLLLLIGGVFALRAALESGRFTPRIKAEIEAATGYRASIGGIGLALGLIPKLELRDVALSTPGGAAPGVVAPRLAASISLRSLISGGIEIPVVEADGLKLNLDPALWALPATERPARDAAAAPSAPRPAASMPHIGLVRLHDAHVILPGSAGRDIEIPSLSIRNVSAASASDLAAEWRFQGITFTLAGKAGPLFGATPGTLPPLGAITLRASAGDLGWLLPGLRLEGLELIAPPDGEAKLSGALTRAGNTARLEANLGEIGKLLYGFTGPLPMEARLTSADASMTLKGAVARPLELADGQFDLTVDVPDAAGLSGFPALPPGLRGSARLEWRDPQNISLPRFQLTSPALVANAALTLGLAGRPNLTGQIEVTRLDLDALSPAPAPAPSAARPAPAAPAAGDGRIIPDIALPVAALNALDAELRLAISGVTSRNLPQAALQTNLRLSNGALTLAPFNLTIPAGRIAGQVTVNAAANPAQFGLRLRSDGAGLDLAALSGALDGLGLRGRGEIAADLRGAGATTRAIAASLDGDLGLALVNARLEQGTAMEALGALLALLSPASQRLGAVELRCLALAFGATQGVAQSRALFMDSAIGQISGQAAINLRDESLNGRLDTNLRVLGVGLRAPVNLGGTLAAPRIGVAAGAALGQTAIGLLGDTLTGRVVTDPLGNLLGGAGRNADADCAEPLRIARLGADGPAPAARAAPEAAPEAPRPGTPALPSPVQDVLRGLGGILGGGRR
ncbi:MAG: AsmA family protein [Roseomonas sp.]|nr:AsmA family protein [Roseomonas sp.]MCA3430678.1 AsmA family protein [Roseomonas sp.]MCA3433989.1 AsmA family protein [Roseomonas sp.]